MKLANKILFALLAILILASGFLGAQQLVQDVIVSSNAAFSWQLDTTRMMGIAPCAPSSTSCSIYTRICDLAGNCVNLKDGSNTFQIITVRAENGAFVHTQIGNFGIQISKMTVQPGGQLTY